MQQVAGEAPAQPLRALTLGPCRVIGSEYPNVQCVNVDLEASSASPAPVDASDETFGENFVETFVEAQADEQTIRRHAVTHGIPAITTIHGSRAAVAAIHSLKRLGLRVKALQDFHAGPAGS